jgi:hypothetical protein
MICREHGEGDRQAEKHTKDTTHPTMTSIHPRPTVETDDVRFHGGNEVVSE